MLAIFFPFFLFLAVLRVSAYNFSLAIIWLFPEPPPRPTPHGLWHGKLEWMSQTPTVVLVLLNLRHCTIVCTGFGSRFSHFTSETTWHDSAYEIIQKQIKRLLLIEKYLLCWLSCMTGMLQCMISKVQCWQSFSYIFFFLEMGLWALWERGDATFYFSCFFYK